VWEATVDAEPEPGFAEFACSEVTTLRQVDAPALNGVHHARFAVLCARAAYTAERFKAEFGDWAAGWLTGADRSGIEARALADMLEDEGHDDLEWRLTQPHEFMLASAVRAAAHASRMSWLVGRARDEENTRAIERATAAVQTALRVARLDLVGLAEQAVPKLSSALAPTRPGVVPAAPNRILRPLPT
jgi:hypothetical protein